MVEEADEQVIGWSGDGEWIEIRDQKKLEDSILGVRSRLPNVGIKS